MWEFFFLLLIGMQIDSFGLKMQQVLFELEPGQLTTCLVQSHNTCSD